MKRLLYLSLFSLLIIPTSLKAQDTFEEYKKQFQQEFQDYKDKRDKEFASMLEEAWLFIDVNVGESRYSKPKVEEIPVATPELKNAVKSTPVSLIPITVPMSPRVPLPIDSIKPVKRKTPSNRPFDQRPLGPKDTLRTIPPIPTPNLDPVPPPREETSSHSTYPEQSVAFYSISTTFPVDPKIRATPLRAFDQKSITQFWKSLSTTDFESTIRRVRQTQQKHSLNDWALGNLVQNFSAEVYPDEGRQTLFIWFVMTKLGFAAKVGYNDAGIYLLIPTSERLYNVKYFIIENEKHYVIRFSERNFDPGSIYTYKGTYPNADRKLRLQLSQYPSFAHKTESRTLTFSYDNQSYSIDVVSNIEAIQFFKKYPQTDLPVYFNAPVYPQSQQHLIDGLSPLLEEKSETEKVTLLLRFVQTAFEYKTDDDQFGFEKYFFVEETLFYPYSDCEDRSVLFAFLVKELVGLDVIGLKYPGHLATAVAFSTPTQGDQLMFNRETFTVCDPTYKFADIGMSMPNFKDSRPEVVQL